MNYRHIYHAGNFADVFKHVVLVALIQLLSKKEKGFGFLDTHAGAGRYDLKSSLANKSKEFQSGIEKIFNEKNSPELIQEYLQCIHKINNNEKLQFYPGSPLIVRQLLRQQDRMILTELHSEEFNSLKQIFAHDKQVSLHHQDGYQALKAFLPLKERRGLVLIDPPYEKPDELTDTIKQLSLALKRWETGVFALWYPIKDHRSLKRFQQSVSHLNHPTLSLELCIYPDDQPTQLNGSGMLIVNPPWQMDIEMKKILPWLWEKLSPSQLGRISIYPNSK